MNDGRIVKRDPSTGRILKTELTPEQASEMGKRRWEKGRQSTRTTLLEEAGYPNSDDAPEHLTLLAEIASSGRSGAVAALRDFLRLTRPISGNPGEATVVPGEKCPTCRQFVMRDMHLDQEGIAALKRFIQFAREKGIGVGMNRNPIRASIDKQGETTDNMDNE